MDWIRSPRLLLTHPNHLLHKYNLDFVGGYGITLLGPPSSAKLLSRGVTTELMSVFVVISLRCFYEIKSVRGHQ